MASIRDSTQSTTASGNSVTVTTPTGATAGDYLLAFVQTDATVVTLVDDSTDFGAAKQQNGTWGASTALFGVLLSGAPDASYTFSYTGTADQMLAALVAVQPGAGETFDSFASTINVDATGTATGITSSSITVPATPSVLLLGFGNDANRTVVTPPSGMTATETVDGSASELIVYYQIDATPGATTKSIDWNLAEQMSAIAAVVGFAVAAGPTIDTQPTAQTCTINNSADTTATFTCDFAEALDSATYEFEDSAGAGTYTAVASSGIHSLTTNLDTGLCTWVITPTTKTGITGRKIRIKGTTASGTTTSNEVLLTVYTGFQHTSPTTGVTDSNGQFTVTWTDDRPGSVLGNGGFVKHIATSGSAVSRSSARPT